MHNQRMDDQVAKRTKEILQFERMLHDDGYVVIKFFLHIDEQVLKERMEQLEKTHLPNGVLLNVIRSNIINTITTTVPLRICSKIPILQLHHGM